MSKKVYIFLADGFEDIEGLTVVDLMRRAGITVDTVSIKDNSPQYYTGNRQDLYRNRLQRCRSSRTSGRYAGNKVSGRI